MIWERSLMLCFFLFAAICLLDARHIKSKSESSEWRWKNLFIMAVWDSSVLPQQLLLRLLNLVLVIASNNGIFSFEFNFFTSPLFLLDITWVTTTHVNCLDCGDSSANSCASFSMRSFLCGFFSFLFPIHCQTKTTASSFLAVAASH